MHEAHFWRTARALNKPDTNTSVFSDPSLTDCTWKMIQHIQQSAEILLSCEDAGLVSFTH